MQLERKQKVQVKKIIQVCIFIQLLNNNKIFSIQFVFVT